MEWIFLTLLRPIANGVIASLASYSKRENKVPLWAFYSLSHIAPNTAFELLIIRDGSNGPEIFLTKRPPQDPEWPNMWHFPGTIIRINDSFESVKLRLAQDELFIDKLPAETNLLTTKIYQDPPRGNGIHLFEVIRVDATFENKNGTFFPFADLPDVMIGSQKEQLTEIRQLL